ncbi:hypothetical protein, partial [Cecembia sp.]
SAAIILFIMAVHNSLKSKKSQIQELQLLMSEGIKTLTDISINEMPSDTQKLSEKFQLAKISITESQEEEFHQKVRKPYQQIKLIKSQYNQLIARKPYSFVAKIMGHQPF